MHVCQRAGAILVAMAALAFGGASAAMAQPYGSAAPQGPVKPLSAWDCENYINDHGYIVGPKIIAACNAAASGLGGLVACYADMSDLQVPADVGTAACDLAAQWG